MDSSTINEGGDEIKATKIRSDNTSDKVFEDGSIESLIPDEDSDTDDSTSFPALTADQLHRWYNRGTVRFRNHTRMDDLIGRVLGMEAYMKEVMGVEPMKLELIKNHRERVIRLNTDDDEPDAANDG